MVADKVRFRINYNNGSGTAYFPKKLLGDSAFPFESHDELFIYIEGDKLVIEKEQSTIKAKAGDLGFE